MRIKFGNKIIEFDHACQSGGTDRFVEVWSKKHKYTIDCETDNYARWLMSILLTDGYFDASGVDYDNSNDWDWLDYCINKTDEQRVFEKWINEHIKADKKIV